MTHTPYSVSVIVPVYNEIELLERSISYIDSFLKKEFHDYEIIVIESGSDDGSYQMCDKIASLLNKVKVIHEGARNGFGAALKLGYRNATKDLIWVVTVDLPFPLEAILKALPLFSEFDCVLSYRSHDDRSVFVKTRSFVYNMIVRAILGLNVKHVNSAFKVLKRDVIKNMPLVLNGWALDAEILYRIKTDNISFATIPVEARKRKTGKSSITMMAPFAILKEIIHIKMNAHGWREKNPHK